MPEELTIRQSRDGALSADGWEVAVGRKQMRFRAGEVQIYSDSDNNESD